MSENTKKQYPLDKQPENVLKQIANANTTDEEPIKFNNGKTQIRKITKPIHLLGLYGKWAVLIFLGYKLIDLLVNMFSSM